MIAIPRQEKFDGMFFKQNWNILQKRISMVQNYGPLRQKYFTAKKKGEKYQSADTDAFSSLPTHNHYSKCFTPYWLVIFHDNVPVVIFYHHL